MNLNDMIRDYCRRTGRLTPGEVQTIIAHNRIIATDDGFAVFAWVLDEFHVLFAYAAPGRRFAALEKATEEYARWNNIKRIKFSTDRPEVFGRRFKGYKPVATIMSKELV